MCSTTPDNQINPDTEFLYNDESFKIDKPVIKVNELQTKEELYMKRLIRLVRKKPALYDIKYLKNNGKVKIRDRIWKSIGKKLNSSVDECKFRWTRIRMALNRILKGHRVLIAKGKLPPSAVPTWKYYKYLEFLLPHTRTHNISCRRESYSDDEEDIITPRSSSRLVRPTVEQEWETIEIDDDEDDDEDKAIESQDNYSKENHLETIKIENTRCEEQDKITEINGVEFQQTEDNVGAIKIKNVTSALVLDNIENNDMSSSNIKIEYDSSDLQNQASTSRKVPNCDKNLGNIKAENVISEQQDHGTMNIDIPVDDDGQDFGNMNIDNSSSTQSKKCTIDNRNSIIELQEDNDIINNQTPEIATSDLQDQKTNIIEIDVHETQCSTEIDNGEIDDQDIFEDYEDNKTEICRDVRNNESCFTENIEVNEISDSGTSNDCYEKEDANNIIDEKLLDMVKVNSILYQGRGHVFWVREERRKTWEVISKKLGLNIEDCKIRWECLKRRFINALKYPINEKRDAQGRLAEDTRIRLLKKKWILTHMEFFLPHTKNRIYSKKQVEKVVDAINNIERPKKEETMEHVDEVVSDSTTEQQTEDLTWSDDEAEDFVLKSYITGVLQKKENRVNNRNAPDLQEDELSSYYTNFFNS